MLQKALDVKKHRLSFIYLFQQKDTMAIKKRSSRTRRIRPVSTRLSEFLCHSSQLIALKCSYSMMDVM